MNYANPGEVHLADLGEGVELAVIGVPPRERLPLEANYGFLLMSNGVPIGYGGVSPLFRQANTGINVFDPFRGSEAAFLWVQTLRAFRTLFGVRRFIINGYQFGAGNSEAIASGAYWFYWRLGFRPSLPENVALAAEEGARLKESPTRRTPAAVLRRLARGDLILDLADWDADDVFEEPLLTATRRGRGTVHCGAAGCVPRGRRTAARAQCSRSAQASIVRGEARAMSAMDSNASRRWLRCSISPHGRPASAMRCCSGCRRRVRRPSRSSPGSARGKFAFFRELRAVGRIEEKRALMSDRSDRGGETRRHAV